MAFAAADIELAWEGSGEDEKGYNAATGQCVVEIDPRYYRPTEVDLLQGDAAKARETLGWTPDTPLETMAEEMVTADIEEAREELTIEQAKLLKFCEQGYFGYLQAQLLRELKSKLYDAYNTMDYRYYIRRNTGHFINVINGQIDGFYRSFREADRLSLAVHYDECLLWHRVSHRMGVCPDGRGCGAVILFLFKYLNVYVRSLSRKAAQEKSTMNSLLVQALQGFKYISATGQKEHLREGVIQSIWRYTGYELRQSDCRSFTSALKEPVSVLLLIRPLSSYRSPIRSAYRPDFCSADSLSSGDAGRDCGAGAVARDDGHHWLA